MPEKPNVEVSYDAVRCETRIESLVMPDFMLEEMGLTLEEFLEQINRAKLGTSTLVHSACPLLTSHASISALARP
jgi:hypothetical protein